MRSMCSEGNDTGQRAVQYAAVLCVAICMVAGCARTPTYELRADERWNGSRVVVCMDTVARLGRSDTYGITRVMIQWPVHCDSITIVRRDGMSVSAKRPGEPFEYVGVGARAGRDTIWFSR
jgi:hypothetical protein